MKWTARALTASALMALAATVLLGRSLQQQGVGAAAAPTASETGQASLAQAAAVHEQAATQAMTQALNQAAAQPAPTPAAVPDSTASPPAAAAAPALQFSYVGHWTDRGRTQVVLQRDGASFTVQGPGRLDDAYEVLAVSAQQLTLLHRVSGTRHLLDFDAAGASTATGGAAAGEAGVTGVGAKGLQRALPVGIVPPAHAPTNTPGDTEDQQESN